MISRYASFNQRTFEPIISFSNSFGKRLVYTFSQAVDDRKVGKTRPWIELAHDLRGFNV